MQGIDLLDTAARLFYDRVSTVTGVQWTRPTPCEAWAVQDLADHVIAGNRLAVELLGGSVPGHHDDVAQDPVVEFRRSAERQRGAFARADRTGDVAHPAGRITVGEFLIYRAADITVHTWDLARAIDAEDRLPSELVEHALSPYVAWVATLEVEEMFGPGAGVDHHATEQDRLLGQLGRRP